MRAAVLALTGLFGCGFRVDPGTVAPGDDQPPPDASDAPVAGWLDGFADRLPIDLAAQPSAMPDFVASITREADPALAGAQAIAFAAADGITPLPDELVAFDPQTGKLEAWVQAPLGTAPTRIYLYYGAGPPPITASVWSDKVAGVWHMGGGHESKLGHDATPPSPGTTPMRDPMGIVGVASRFDGNDDTMSVGDPPDGALDFADTSFTVALWVKVDASKGNFDMPIFKGGSSIGTVGWDYELGTGAWNAGFADTSTIQVITFGQEATLLHDWHYLVSQCDREAGVVRTYTDGVLTQASPAPSGTLASSRALLFGDTTYVFKGLLDEVRVYAAALPAERILADYSNIVTREAFCTFGNPEHQP